MKAEVEKMKQAEPAPTQEVKDGSAAYAIDGIGELLPVGWAFAELSHIVKIHDNQRVPINNKERTTRLAGASHTFPYYGATGQVGEIDDYIFDGEAVLLGEDGAPFLEPGKGKAYIVDGKYWVNNHAHILRGNGAISNKLLSHQLNTINYRFYVSGTTRLKLTQSSMKQILLKLPPLKEQYRIVEKIDQLFAELDQGEAALRQTLALLKRYRQSLLKAAVTGELTADWRKAHTAGTETGEQLLERILTARREHWEAEQLAQFEAKGKVPKTDAWKNKYKKPAAPDATNLPELPDGWVWASVDQVSKVIGGLTKNSKRNELPLRRPMLRVANVYQNQLELDNVHETGLTETELQRVRLEYEDILVVEGNGSKEQIGRMAIWYNEITDAVHQNHLIKVRLFEKNLAQWAMCWFQSTQGRHNIEQVASSTSGLYTLSLSKVRSLVLPIPPLNEAQQATEIVEVAFSESDQLETHCQTELARAKALRQSILKDAFAGKLVPQDPNDEPASVLLARIQADRAAKPAKGRKKQ